MQLRRLAIAIVLAVAFFSYADTQQDASRTDGTAFPCNDGQILKKVAGAWACAADDSGGGSTPTGTGFRHVTGGVEDAAAKLVENADVAAGAAIAESKLALNFPTHSNANDPSAGEKAALPGTSGVPSGTNKYVTDADPRNTNARTPTTHGSAAHDSTVEATANKGVVSGYASLDGSTLVPTAQLGTGTPSSSNFLRGDRVWAAGGGGTAITVARLTADASTTGTTPVELTGLALTLSANTNYVIRCVLYNSTAVSTTGTGLSWTTGATVTGARFGYAVSSTGGASASFLLLSTTTPGTEATSPANLATNTLHYLDVLIRVGATGGTLTPRFRSEVSGSNVTIFADSFCTMFSF